MQSGCYPDKQNPPTINDFLAKKYEIVPWPPKKVKLREVEDYIDADIVREIQASSGFDYYEETITFDSMFSFQFSTYTTLLITIRTDEKPRGFYENTFSPKNKLIVAQSTYRTPNSPHWSDATFAMWKHVCGKDSASISSLKYVVRALITNDDTLHVMETIRKKVPAGLPSISCTPTGFTAEWFRAFLGTPNGAGVAYLLMEHKAALTAKTISRITAYFGDGDTHDLLLEFSDLASSGLVLSRSQHTNYTSPALGSCANLNSSDIIPISETE